ncbi:MAG TPA: NnrS family protein [Casimicrobiaceae bacterium]|nr:NnrS family protein [Casimicrobiaceae bacterium]
MMNGVHAIGRAAASRTFGLWNLGFRPFYLLASIFAALSVALWVCQYAGVLPFTYVRGPAWHGSEMLFGFVVAIVAGFLFTAVRNWTGRPTPSGPMLAGYALLWIAGRILAATPYLTAAAWVNGAFPIAVALGVAVPLLASRNRRNYFFVALLAALGVVAVALHLSYFGVLEWPERVGLQAGLDIVLFIMAVVGGRVIPMFTNNGVPGTRARRNPIVEKLALGGVLLLLVVDIAQPSAGLAVLTAALAIVHAVRLALWQPWRTLRTPLVWILHAAYGWIVVHLALRALAALDLVPYTIALHALTIGGIGGLTIGMMTRTARGHTGRPLVADRRDAACYILVMLAAFVRVFGGLALPGAYLATVIAAGACWSTAFIVYAIAYAPWLIRARLDGKPG